MDKDSGALLSTRLGRLGRDGLSVANWGEPAPTEERSLPALSGTCFKVTGIASCKSSSLSVAKAQ